jgi:hypothetical protein
MNNVEIPVHGRACPRCHPSHEASNDFADPSAPAMAKRRTGDQNKATFDVLFFPVAQLQQKSPPEMCKLIPP